MRCQILEELKLRNIEDDEMTPTVEQPCLLDPLERPPPRLVKRPPRNHDQETCEIDRRDDGGQDDPRQGAEYHDVAGAQSFYDRGGLSRLASDDGRVPAAVLIFFDLRGLEDELAGQEYDDGHEEEHYVGDDQPGDVECI